MTEELRKQLECLRALAPMLNETTTQASTVIAMVDQFLKGLKLGLPAKAGFSNRRYTERDDNDRKTNFLETSYLAYGRLGGEFRIHVLTETEEQQYDEDTHQPEWVHAHEEQTDWSSCSRNLKLKAFQVLPNLLRDLVCEAQRLATTAIETADTIAAMIKTMEQEAGNDQGKPPEEPSSNTRETVPRSQEKPGARALRQVAFLGKQLNANARSDRNGDTDRLSS